MKCSHCNTCKLKENILKKTDELKIVLVGNPNVGKSVIFNALSGFYVEVSNYPGTTVDVSKAFIELGELIDTPGVYGVSNYTDDEAVTQRVIQTADVVINIASALSIERDFFLTQQLIDMGLPMILVVNQVDEAESRGINIDFKTLEKELGLKVIPTVAIRNKGLAEILKSLKNEDYKISEVKTPYINDLFKGLELTKFKKMEKIIEIEAKDSSHFEAKAKLYNQRKERISEITSKVISKGEKKFNILNYIDDILLNPIAGTIIAIGLLYLLYEILGVFVSAKVVDFIFSYLKDSYTPWIHDIVSHLIPVKFLSEILVGDFGILTMIVQILGGVLLPLIISFYLFMAILEDSGYLPRLAVLMDNVFSKIGLNGRAIIPILLGFGCGTMGVITTRILGTQKERTIATAILGLTIPCAAQLAIVIALLSRLASMKAWFIYIICIFSLLLLTGTVLNKLIKGRATDLLIDIPPLRFPVIANTINKTIFRVVSFLKDATPLFIIGSALVTLLNLLGALDMLEKILAPVVVNLLHLPAIFSNIFIMGLIRRDFASIGLLGMAGVESGKAVMTQVQIIVSAVVVTLYVPCLAALIVMYKERGFKTASFVWIGTLFISLIVGTILARILPLFI